MRKDAARNRAKIVAAAREVMREEGGCVSFEAIAEMAGVTRGTMYRNFVDRQDLYEVVLVHELERMTHAIAALPEDDALGFVRILAEMMMVYEKFLSLYPSQPDYKADGVSEERISAVIVARLAAAQAKGVLRSDLTAFDILLACRMMAANWRMDFKPSLRDALDDRLALFMRGLGGSPTRRAVDGDGGR